MLGLNESGNYHALAFWGTFLKYSLLHIFLFSLSMLPFFRLTKRRIRALGTFLHHRILITLLVLLATTWGFYAYQLSLEASVFEAGFFTGMTIWLSLTLFGFLLYATLISVLWAWVARTPRLLQMVVLLLVLAIYAIVIVQASFIVLSGRELPEFNQSVYASHLDMAPTILDLMGMPKPAGYWGRSLYDPQTAGRKAWFTYNEGTIYFKDGKEEKEWLLNFEPKLQRLFNKFLVETNA